MSVKRPRSTGRLAEHHRTTERAFLAEAVERFNGHSSKAAEWLGITRRTLYDKLRLHGLDGVAAGLRCEAGIGGPRDSAAEREAAP